MKWCWLCVLALVVVLALLLNSCWQGGAVGEAVSEEEATLMTNSQACNHGDTTGTIVEPGTRVDAETGPAPMRDLPRGDGDFVGPLYRPRLLMGPAGFTPDPAQPVTLEKIELAPGTGATVLSAFPPQDGSDEPGPAFGSPPSPADDSTADDSTADDSTADDSDEGAAPAQQQQREQLQAQLHQDDRPTPWVLDNSLSFWRFPTMTDYGPPTPEPPDIDPPESVTLSPVTVDLLNDTVSVWWIAEAEEERFLDPANVALGLYPNELKPIHVLVPSGGHMYGGEGPITWSDQRTLGDPGDGANTSVLVIDTSFHEWPVIGREDTVQGHGSYINGIVTELLPGVKITSVDLGPEGQNLTSALSGEMQQLYQRIAGGPIEAVDELQILLAILEMQVRDSKIPLDLNKPLDDDVTSDTIGTIDLFHAVNLSFGTYNCDGATEPGETKFEADLAHPPEGLEALIDKFGEADIFAAAGNDHTAEPWWPAAFGPEAELNVHSIGALNADGTDWAWFSNRGDWVELCIRGENVSARPIIDGEWLIDQRDDDKDQPGYLNWSGTSFAAPTALAVHRGAGGGANVLGSCP